MLACALDDQLLDRRTSRRPTSVVHHNRFIALADVDRLSSRRGQSGERPKVMTSPCVVSPSLFFPVLVATPNSHEVDLVNTSAFAALAFALPFPTAAVVSFSYSFVFAAAACGLPTTFSAGLLFAKLPCRRLSGEGSLLGKPTCSVHGHGSRGTQWPSAQ